MENKRELQDNVSKGIFDKNIYRRTLFSKYSFWKILKITVVFIIVTG